MWWPCGNTAAVTPGPPAPIGSSLDPMNWMFQYSPGVPAFPSGAPQGFTFSIPLLPGSVHYLVTPINRMLRPMSMDFGLEMSDDALLTARVPGASISDDGVPGVRLYFQRARDDMSGVGDYEYYRWWANSTKIELKQGRFQVAVDLNPANWSSVYGQPGTVRPDLFNAAVADCVDAGMTFGGNFAGHGVALTSGSATCTVYNFVA